jgi:PPOX class probable F420-dependent enzyme
MEEESMALTQEQREYLAGHTLAVLGTGRKDGSPQLSTIIYDWDGEHVYISVTSDRAKWRNAMRQPKVSLLVPDGRRQLIVYGTAEGIPGGPERDERIAGIRARMGNPLPEDYDRESFSRTLNEAKRVVLKITPERAFSNE